MADTADTSAIEAARRSHLCTSADDGSSICVWCGKPWPCLVSQLLADNARLTAALGEAEQRLLDQSEHDALVAWNALTKAEANAATGRAVGRKLAVVWSEIQHFDGVYMLCCPRADEVVELTPAEAAWLGSLDERRVPLEQGPSPSAPLAGAEAAKSSSGATAPAGCELPAPSSAVPASSLDEEEGT